MLYSREDMRGIALCMSRPGLESVFRIGQNASSLAHWLLDMGMYGSTDRHRRLTDSPHVADP